MKERINLNFNWFYSDNFTDKHLYDYLNQEGFELVDLPHSGYTVPFNNFDDTIFNNKITYKKVIYIKRDYYGKRLNLVFEGVAHLSTIYVNDNFVMEHKGGYDEFTVDISDYVNYGTNNIITVVVSGEENESIPPFGSYLNFLGYIGIYREVYLDVKDVDEIISCKIRTPNVNNQTSAYCDVVVSKYPVNIEIVIKYNGDIKLCRGYNIYQKHNVLEFNIPDRKLWDVDNPNLYNVCVEMASGGIVLDQVEFNFGYREVRVDKENFYLNDKPIKLIGLTRNQSYPYVGMAMPKSAQRKDAEIMKHDLGLNCVYLNSCFHSKHFLNACDEMGLLVLEEIPGYRYIGNDEFKVNTIKNVEKMIERSINHPSVIMWGVTVCNSDCNKGLYNKTTQTAHIKDPTRPTFGTFNLGSNEYITDVIGFINPLENYSKLFKNKKFKKSNKPSMITMHTGYNYSVKMFDSEDKKIKQIKNHLSVLNDYIITDNIGIIGSSLTDYNTHKNFGSGDNVNYHGILDMFRNEKPACNVYKSANNNNPFIHLSSNLACQDYDFNKMEDVYLFTNMDFIDIYRNDLLMGRYRGCKSKYGNIKNPPIILEDLIGDLLVTVENFKEKHSKKLKKIIKDVDLNNISKKDRLFMKYITLKYKLKDEDLLNLYYKYKVGEYDKEIVYRFEGYKNNEHLKTMYYSNLRKVNFKVYTDNNKLVIDDTYDVSKVTVKCVDQNDHLMSYTQYPINIKSFGGVDVIGPTNLCLTGGYASFWVKTNGKKEKGLITILVDDKTFNVEFDIIDKYENIK